MKEYRFERFPINNSDLATEKMNKMSAEGWDLVAGTVAFVNNAYVVWLVREVEQPKKRNYRKLGIGDELLVTHDYANTPVEVSDTEK